MTWFEAIIDGIRFIFEELLAPVFDWLANALEDGLFGLIVLSAIGFLIIFISFILGIPLI